MRSIWNLCLGGIACFILVACGPTSQTPPTSYIPGQSHGGPLVDHVSLVDQLRGRGLTVDILGRAQQPFLRGYGTRLRVLGGDIKQPVELESYNYDQTELQADALRVAEEDAGLILLDGTHTTGPVNWGGTPHFFRKQRVIVIYVGDDQIVLDLLAELLGSQFVRR